MLLLLWWACIASLLAPGSKLLALAQQNPVSKTLRSFPNGRRNCYTLKPDRGKNNLYLIRAYFWYGDYDGKDEQPTFDLYIDVNYWTTIGSVDNVAIDIMYVSQADYIQVCVVNMGSGVPFISALELRVLNNSIYGAESGFLRQILRSDMGTGPRSYTRYPRDVYDRIWWGVENYSQLLPSAGASATSLFNDNDVYKVPGKVLTTAETMSNGNSSLSYSWTPPKPYVPPGNWILYFHFAKIESLPSGQQREFTISIDGNQFTENVTLEYLKPVTIVSTPNTGSQINVSISPPSKEFPYPPILNAVEVYNIVGLPYVQTAKEDVKAINDTKATYQVSKESWQGDPCVSSSYIWDGLNCSYVKPPRIISLNLSSSNLVGNISSSFSNLFALESLYLSGNNLTGLVPKALKRRVEDKTLHLRLVLSLTFAAFCQSNNCPTRHVQPKMSIAPIIASVAAVLVLILFGALAPPPPTCHRPIASRHPLPSSRRSTSSGGQRPVGDGVGDRRGSAISGGGNWRPLAIGGGDVATITTTPAFGGPIGTSRLSKDRHFTSTEVTRITDNFRTVIGEGGFGKVYLGRLGDGTQVAVKMLSPSSKQGYKEFHTEAQLLMLIHHRNLVSLIGYCEEFENLALIYEFMSNGNVRQHLSAHNPNVLSWSQRLQIAIDAAQGLEYLHNGCKPPIIHRDLKTANILLDENLRAKICDFGLSKAFVTEQDSHISTRPAGTPGYLDPEFHMFGHLSQKSDIYSFGIVLLELITGQPAIIRSSEDSMHLLHWVTPLVERGDIQSIVDPRLNDQFNIGSARKAVDIAMSCVPTKVVQRADVNRVLSELKECLTVEISSGRSQRMGNSERSEFEITTTELDSLPYAR
ncbi:hypothetical protein BT93_J2023 [Corymbia citriodora subsp. variegata]|nr:hypothetical protein BT93_J2023 [Corymbia citriodora subsp. variegata]